MEQQSSEAEWRNWFNEHGPKLWLFARQKANAEMDAQDLMQEAILEAARRNAPNGPPAVALVFATIQRRAIDWARRHQRRTVRECAVAEAAPIHWFDTAVEDRERASLVQQTLGKLSPDFREVVLLKVWGELSFLQIGETLGISPNTAASRYRYGLAELRKLMKEVFT